MNKNNSEKETIYRYEDDLLQLVKGKYYEYHKAKYTVYPETEHGMIRINARMDYCINNK